MSNDPFIALSNVIVAARKLRRELLAREHRSCAHLFCLRMVYGPVGTTCDECSGQALIDDHLCPHCDNESEDML